MKFFLKLVVIRSSPLHLFHSQKPFTTVSNNFLLSIYKNSVLFLFTSKCIEILIKPNLVEMFERLEEMWLTITHHILWGYYRNLIIHTENLHLLHLASAILTYTYSCVRAIFRFFLRGSSLDFFCEDSDDSLIVSIHRELCV